MLLTLSFCFVFVEFNGGSAKATAVSKGLGTLDEKSTSSGIAEPYARQKLKARTGGEKGRHL